MLKVLVPHALRLRGLVVNSIHLNASGNFKDIESAMVTIQKEILYSSEKIGARHWGRPRPKMVSGKQPTADFDSAQPARD
jgi:hypothetical protein